MVRIRYLDEGTFPSTFVGEFYEENRIVATAGNFEILEINFSDYCDIEPPISDPENDPDDNTTTSIINTELENSVTLFPTLATDFINLDCADNICSDLSIIDVQGQVIQHWQEGQSTTSLRNFDISKLPSGNYFVRTNIKGYYLTRRFTKI